jgi:hypothetical protein
MFEQSDNVDPVLWACFCGAAIGLPSSANELQNEAPQSAPQSKALTPKKR